MQRAIVNINMNWIATNGMDELVAADEANVASFYENCFHEHWVLF
jgi:hypothetical protein